jgi:hypothetical protein
MAVFVLVTTGCSLFSPHALPPPTPPLKLLVAEVTLKAPVTSPTDLQSFREPLSPEVKPVLLAQLIEEVEVKAQRLFIEQLGQQPGFTAVPFAEARRMRATLDSTHKELDATQLRVLGAEAAADVVLSGHILDYGKVHWQYWVPGLAVSMLAETLIVGAATGFNPAIMAATAGSELLTDVPFWWGGAYIAGWAFRPVRIQVAALQVMGCAEPVWHDEEVIVLIPWKTLAKYLPEERQRKEVQLEVNLSRALAEVAVSAGRELRLKPCDSKQS